LAAKKKTEQNKSGRYYLQFIVPAIIVVATLIIYNPSMNSGFLLGWDDTEYLTHEDVQQLNAGNIFSDYHLGMYQPLAVISLALNYASAQESPGAYHATNLFLHIINILLVWLFLLRLSRRRLIAGIGAFLFAMHPINVEPVAWIAARSTLLFTAFYLGGLLTYLKYIENKKVQYILITAVLALAAMFTKSLAISFPFALLIIDYYKDRKWDTKLFIEKIPFIVFSFIFGFITVDAASTYGHISALQYDYSLIDRFFILCHTYVFYLVNFIAPHNLSSIYAYPELSGGGLPILYYLSAIIPIGLSYIIYRYWNKQKEIIAGILFFSFAVAPVLPLFWSRIFVAADRYAYLSFIGLFLLVAILIDRLLNKGLIRNLTLRYSAAAILILYGIFLMYSTNKQCKYWIDSDVLLARAVILSKSGPEKALAHFYHGNVKQGIAENKYSEGQTSSNEGMIRNSFIYYREAVADYDSVIKYNPEYMLAYSNRGMIYGTLHSYDEKYWEMALSDFDKAISLDPDYADNYYNKAWLIYISGDKQAACDLWQTADIKGSVVAKQALDQNCR
jgi:tetratricopeptide (TPR) repeat protein